MKARPILFSGPMVRALLSGSKTQTRRIVKPPVKWAQLFPFCEPTWTAAPHEIWWWDGERSRVGASQLCPYGVPGDLLWVRESHYLTDDGDAERAVYAVDEAAVREHLADVERLTVTHPSADWSRHAKLRPSIHMPRWASRLTLRVADVRVERLQDISAADAVAEGLYRSTPDDDDRAWFVAHHEEQTGLAPAQAVLDEFSSGVWMAPGAPQGWGLTKAERQRDTWGPTPQFAYRLVWESINGRASWDANPFVWAVSFQTIVKNVDEVIRERAG